MEKVICTIRTSHGSFTFIADDVKPEKLFESIKGCEEIEVRIISTTDETVWTYRKIDWNGRKAVFRV